LGVRSSLWPVPHRGRGEACGGHGDDLAWRRGCGAGTPRPQWGRLAHDGDAPPTILTPPRQCCRQGEEEPPEGGTTNKAALWRAHGEHADKGGAEGNELAWRRGCGAGTPRPQWAPPEHEEPPEGGTTNRAALSRPYAPAWGRCCDAPASEKGRCRMSGGRWGGCWHQEQAGGCGRAFSDAGASMDCVPTRSMGTRRDRKAMISPGGEGAGQGRPAHNRAVRPTIGSRAGCGRRAGLKLPYNTMASFYSMFRLTCSLLCGILTEVTLLCASERRVRQEGNVRVRPRGLC